MTQSHGSVHVSQLRQFEPLTGFARGVLEALAGQAQVVEIASSDTLFSRSRGRGQNLLLLAGEVAVQLQGGGEESLLPGQGSARFPLVCSRHLSARAMSDVTAICVDADLLEHATVFDPLAAAPYRGPAHSRGPRWPGALLGEFSALPAAALDDLLGRIEPYAFRAGEMLADQGTDADYLYLLVEGQALVSREFSGPEGELIELHELGEGQHFGTEALHGGRSSATVSVPGDGMVLRLSPLAYQAALARPAAHNDLPIAKARHALETGARWLDVREPAEFRAARLPGARNLPLRQLKSDLQDLDPSCSWLCYCGTGQRARAAATILAAEGYRAWAVEPGFWGMSEIDVRD